jgi:uroporphyrinogen III methyltransferase/synthase
MKVVNTRSRDQSEALSSSLRERGYEVIEAPTIAIVDPDDKGEALTKALHNLADYKWCVFTSVNTVEKVFSLIDSVVLHGVLVAAIGEGTAAALEENEVFVDLLPKEFVAESLVEEFPDGSGKVLLPRAAVARDVLPEGLRAKGWTVDVVDAYKTVSLDITKQLNEVRNADLVAFTAPSTVESFFKSATPDDLPKIVACIGPVTSQAVARYGRIPEIVAPVHSIPGLVEAIVSHGDATATPLVT